MTYLIDGYNLLYALGLVHAKMGPHGLKKARLGLLGRLSGVYGSHAPDVTVVFDAHHAPPGAPDREDYQGLHIQYAVRYAEADELIEQIIHQSSAPKQLTVVSDDQRLQRAARRRHCHVRGCLAYLDDLRRTRQSHGHTRQGTEKREGLSDEEAKQWLEEFASLADDPELRALEPFDYRDEGFEDGAGV